MADRRPWPAVRPPEAALSIAAQRARAYRATSDAELRAFLTGMRLAHTAAVDLAEEVYEVADGAVGDLRAEGNARAAGVKLAADRIGALFDATAREGGVKPGRKGLRAMLRALTGASG